MTISQFTFQDYLWMQEILQPQEDLIPQKLVKGLGISKMAIVDANQDPACLASNACLKIMQKNKLSPEQIGRLYVATESSF